MALIARDVDFAFEPGRPVLRGASLALEPGVTAILGPNGAGKSTLLKIMLGLIAPGAGLVELNGEPVPALDERRRAARLIYVPQSSSPAFGFSVEDVVSMGRYALPRDPDAARRALERVGLLARARDPFASLSAGQQQLATLARALAQADNPHAAALLADEPASAMDPAHQSICASILREQAARGLAVGVVVHDFALASRLATRAAVLVDGQVRHQGPASEVLAPETLRACFGVTFARYASDAGHAFVAPAP